MSGVGTVPEAPEAGTVRAGRTKAWWLADRQALWTSAALLPVLLGLAAYGLVSEFDLWRFEYPRAADRAGVYFFFSEPVLAGLCAWNAYRWRVALNGLQDGLPAPGLIARASWLPTATVALVVHTLILAVHLGVARFSGALGQLDWRPILGQYLAIPACCALGALIGGLSRSVFAAPGLFLAMLAANTLLAQWGFRRFSEVGTGAADFVDLRYAAGYLWPKVVLYAALTLVALPLRWMAWSWWADRLRTAVLVLVVVVSAVTVWTYNGPMLEVRREARQCTGQAPEVCVPISMRAERAAIDSAIVRVVSLLRAQGITDVPARVDVISRGATSVPKGEAGLLVSGATLHADGTLRREVARAFSAAQMCDDMTSPSGPPENVITARAALDGWLQTHTDSVVPGTFPPDAVAALDRGSEAERRAALKTLFTAVWTCSPSVAVPR